MVDMRVRQDNGVDLAHVELEGVAIECFQRPGSLEQAAIYEDRLSAMA